MEKTIAFIDYENVPNIDQSEILHNTELYLLIGQNQVRKPFEFSQKIIDKVISIKTIKVKVQGHNALDFILAFYLGSIIENDSKSNYVVFSNDSGYDALIVHLKEKGINIRRIEVDNKNKVVTENSEKSKEPKIKNDDKLEIVISIIKKTPIKNRPKKIKGLIAHLQTGSNKKLEENDIKVIIEKLRKKGIIEVEGEKIKFINV